MEVISVSGVSFAYNGKTVLDNITHQFNRGSFTAVMGPNGSGKTTLIRLLSGIIRPRNGKVLINGRSSDSLSSRDIAKTSAYVPQTHTNIFPKSVFETVLLGRNPYISWSPGKNDKRIVADILLRLGLDDIAMKSIDQLSGGQKQRVCIARALAQQPSIILLDEPTASLDLLHQHDVLKLLQELTDSGITVIMAIHDLNLAIKYCSDYIILENGKMQASGGQEVFSQEMVEKVYKVKIRLVEDSGQKYILPLDPLDKNTLPGKV